MKYVSWDEFMAAQRRSGLLQRISKFVTAERRQHDERSVGVTDMCGLVPAIYPRSEDVFRFTTTPLRDVKVVILGQDPYHGPGQADGLAFSVRAGTKVPSSLKNILRELDEDLWQGQKWGSSSTFPPDVGNLTPWTRQGVLLLNTALTVRQSAAGSHLDIWQPFTDEVIRTVVDSATVAPHFILWGAKARLTFERCFSSKTYEKQIKEVIAPKPCWFTYAIEGRPFVESRLVTATYSPHPSPLSADRGFFGSRPFSRANLALQLNNPGVVPIDWRLP